MIESSFHHFSILQPFNSRVLHFTFFEFCRGGSLSMSAASENREKADNRKMNKLMGNSQGWIFNQRKAGNFSFQQTLSNVSSNSFSNKIDLSLILECDYWYFPWITYIFFLNRSVMMTHIIASNISCLLIFAFVDFQADLMRVPRMSPLFITNLILFLCGCLSNALNTGYKNYKG